MCNHTSFIEILYLARRFSPVFVFVSDDGASKGLVHVCGLLEAIYRAFAMPVALDRSTVSSIASFISLLYPNSIGYTSTIIGCTDHFVTSGYVMPLDSRASSKT